MWRYRLKNYWQQVVLYLNLPEMKLFWAFSFFLGVLLIINIVYLPGILVTISALFFLFLGGVLFFNNLRLARLNLEIKLERNQLKSIIINLRDGIIVYDINFKILLFNQAAEAIFGITEAEVLGQVFTIEKAQDSKFKLLAQVIFPSLAPRLIRRSDGGVYPQIVDLSFDEPMLELRVITNRIIDARGNLLGFVKIVRDRTREINILRSKNDFINISAHQLRTPLTAVQWALEELLDMSDPVKAKDLLEMALSAAQKLAKIVNDLLDVAKIEEGKFGYQFENVKIVSFVENIIKEIYDLFQSTGVRFYFKRPSDSNLTLYIDPQKLKIAIFNILDNAARYNVINGEVIVSIEQLPEKPYIDISVKDTGVGIPKDEIGKLFSKFFRAENVLNVSKEGSGLGLYIARNIIKRHGGDIWVESELNRGSTFHILLPVDSKLVPPKEIVYDEENI